MKAVSIFGTDDFVPEDGNWHSIVVYIDKNGKKTTYIDGKKVND